MPPSRCSGCQRAHPPALFTKDGCPAGVLPPLPAEGAVLSGGRPLSSAARPKTRGRRDQGCHCRSKTARVLLQSLVGGGDFRNGTMSTALCLREAASSGARHQAERQGNGGLTSVTATARSARPRGAACRRRSRRARRTADVTEHAALGLLLLSAQTLGIEGWPPEAGHRGIANLAAPLLFVSAQRSHATKSMNYCCSSIRFRPLGPSRPPLAD